MEHLKLLKRSAKFKLDWFSCQIFKIYMFVAIFEIKESFILSSNDP